MNKPEILAPAGSFDSLTAAVRCGADAVYLGGRELNARRNAANSATRSWRRRSNTAMRAGSRFISRSTPLCVTMRLKRR